MTGWRRRRGSGWVSEFKRLAADVAEGELDGALRERDQGYAGELADGLFVGAGERGARGRERAGEEEAGEGAVDVAAGTDALDDLLAEVTALGEVEGAGLGCSWGRSLAESELRMSVA